MQNEKELLSEIPDGFLLEMDSKIQTVKRLLQLKKVNPDHMSILSQSICRSEHEEEVESLIGEKSFNEQGHLKIDLETTVVREKRIRRIENKFEYVNMICADLNTMVESQTDCIKNLDGNFSKGIQNTVKAVKELKQLDKYQDMGTKKLWMMFITVALLAIGIVFYFWTHPQVQFHISLPRLQ